jgi:very-short-patch-repair endonuclease
LGYDVKRQIGASGFRVDLAISDPDKPGRFLLGIECDGAQYHSSRSARDRDRLRQQVLEAHGWIIHRVWSADWYLRPQAEIAKIEDAIAAARSEWSARDIDGLKPRVMAIRMLSRPLSGSRCQTL